MSELIHGEEERVYGDSGYIGAKKRPEAIKKNKDEKISSTSSTDVHHPSRNYPRAVSTLQRKENIRNHPFAVRLNTFLQ